MRNTFHRRGNSASMSQSWESARMTPEIATFDMRTGAAVTRHTRKHAEREPPIRSNLFHAPSSLRSVAPSRDIRSPPTSHQKPTVETAETPMISATESHISARQFHDNHVSALGILVRRRPLVDEACRDELVTMFSHSYLKAASCPASSCSCPCPSAQ